MTPIQFGIGIMIGVIVVIAIFVYNEYKQNAKR